MVGQNTDAVGIGGDDFRGRDIQRVLHQPDLFETDTQHRAHVQDQKDSRGRQDGRDIDVSNQLHSPGTVDFRSLVKRGVD